MPILLTKHNLEYETSFFNEKTRKNKQVTQLNSTQQRTTDAGVWHL